MPSKKFIIVINLRMKKKFEIYLTFIIKFNNCIIYSWSIFKFLFFLMEKLLNSDIIT